MPQPDAQQGRRPALPAGAAPAAAAVALALLLWAAVGAAVAGAAAVGAAAVLALSGRRRKTQDHGAAFDSLLGGAHTPAALTNEQGRILTANAALRELTGRDSAAAIADWLDDVVVDADQCAYRMMRAAAAGASARETIAGAPTGGAAAKEVAPLTVTVSPVAPRRLLWTVERAPLESAVEGRGAFAPDGLIESLPVAVARLATTGEMVFANGAARAMLGPGAAPGVRIDTLMEGLGRPMETRIAEAARGDGSGRPEIARAEPGGREVFLQVSLTRLDLDGGPGIVAVLADATELKTLEAQFVQSQKMQAVGQLAGGVAHDFNNLLTAITGHTDLLLQRHDYSDPDYADLTQIKQNANRAAGLVRQLLAFSRKQTLRPTVVNLVDTLGETSHLLNRLLGEKYTLRIEHDPALWLVKVDERQFEQVIMNLVVNARDAMPGGGVLRIRTGNAHIEAERHRGRAVMPKGDYVRIEVIDEGTGIPPEKINQIFEPFFTTKRAGEGTGLGLSTVYGIVKQTGGFIFADSSPGAGATFSIYLPRHERGPADVEQPAAVAPKVTDLTGRGVVLLIEDETPVRAFGVRALRLRGYEVLEAASGEEALEILSDPDLRVDVIVSDVVMPGMDGPSCVREARKLRPDVKVVFVSGYAEDALKRSMDGIGSCHFLAKPFSLNDLTSKVKECVSA